MQRPGVVHYTAAVEGSVTVSRWSWWMALALCGQAAWAQDEPAREVVPEGIWDWASRMGGDILPEEALRVRREKVQMDLAERSSRGEFGGHDPLLDIYEDPERALAAKELHLDKLDPREFDLPIVVNSHVERSLRYLLGPGRRHFAKWLERKARYENLIHAELQEEGLPKDLIYLSMIESGFSPVAVSSVGATGLWQFMPATARGEGLRVDWWIDERRDPKVATDAAAGYLRKIHRVMDSDWWLTFAAYNWGQGNVGKAKRRAPEGHDYWQLLDGGFLPRETAGYVPKIIAAAIIGKHPERYGFTELVPHDPYDVDSVKVSGSVDVDVLATCAGLSEDDFRMLNPGLRRFATPEGDTFIHVPRGGGEGFLAALADVPVHERRRIVQHQVGRGESLGRIAARYDVPVDAVIRANKISNPNRIRVGQMLIIPVGGDAPVTTSGSAAVASSGSASGGIRASSYTVKRGDSLSVIAQRVGMSQAELQRINGIRDPSTIQVGQVLKLNTPAPAAVASTTSSGGGEAATSGGSAPEFYKVRSGDSYWSIASKHGLTVAELQKLNGLGSSSVLQPGQRLRLRAAAPAAPSAPVASDDAPGGSYVVRSGDTLSEIAQAHGASTADLIRWNGLRSASHIQVGQKLKVPGGQAGGAAEARTYTVKSGDSLWGIARAHGVTVDQVKGWNDLSGNTVTVGQKLRIEGGGTPVASWKEYKVRSGDSLGRIAERFGVTIAQLRNWNSLSGNLIKVGQVLRIQTL